MRTGTMRTMGGATTARHSRAWAIAMIVAWALIASPCATTAKKVEVGFYMEALCPGCAAFSEGPLSGAVNSTLTSPEIKVQIVAYGNTKHNGKFYECQHGPQVRSNRGIRRTPITCR